MNSEAAVFIRLWLIIFFKSVFRERLGIILMGVSVYRSGIKRYERCVNDPEACGFEDCFLHQFHEIIVVKLSDKAFKGPV